MPDPRSVPIRLALAALLSGASPAWAEEAAWGTLKGRFVVVGALPAAEPLVTGADAACHAAAPVDESVLVGERRGLRNAVVYVRPPRGAELAVHPDYAKQRSEPVELVNKRCAFSPRVCLLRTGQPLVIKNADPTNHSTKLDLLRNTAISEVIPAGGEFATRLDSAERLPTRVSCTIHPFMQGYVLVRDNPYMAVTDAAGRFEIAKLPAGEHQFQFWHETGYLRDVEFDAGRADRRGRVRLTIPAGGELDLGDLPIPASLLTRA